MAGSMSASPPKVRAMCGRLRVSKDFLHERSIGRCSHVFGSAAGADRPSEVRLTRNDEPLISGSYSAFAKNTSKHLVKILIHDVRFAPHSELMADMKGRGEAMSV